MGTNVDVSQLVGNIKTAVAGVVGQDVPAIQGFAEQQLQMLADQAKVVAAGIATGQISEALRQNFLDQLKVMTQTFVQTLAGLIMVTIEKLWNAVAGAVWGWLSTVTGVNFSTPSLAPS